MKIITIICKKGGVGKSVTSVSLACGFARRGYKTLLIDTDSQGSACINLGYMPSMGEDNIANLGQVFYENKTLLEVRYSTWQTNLDIVLASTNLVKLDMHYSMNDSWHELLKESLYPVKDHYDLVIIDTPPALSMITVASLIACHGYLIPVPPLCLDIHSLHMLLIELQQIRELSNIGELYGVLLTRVKRYKTATEHIKQLNSYFGIVNQNLVLLSLYISDKYIINHYYSTLWLNLIYHYFSLSSVSILLSTSTSLSLSSLLTYESLNLHLIR